jgi:hypothetical protein
LEAQKTLDLFKDYITNEKLKIMEEKTKELRRKSKRLKPVLCKHKILFCPYVPGRGVKWCVNNYSNLQVVKLLKALVLVWEVIFCISW